MAEDIATALLNYFIQWRQINLRDEKWGVN